MTLRVFLFIAIAAALGLLLAYSQWMETPDVVSGVLEAHSIQVGSRLGGRIARVAVEEGQDVKAGEELAVVEAMKMENVLRAERDGLVSKIHVQPGDSLAVDQSILEFE